MVHELAGKRAPNAALANIPRLVSAYYTHKPDVSDPTQRVSFGTSGHRGSSLRNSFNEAHVLAISQAIFEYRSSKGITGPLFIGMDTHALSEPAQATALEFFAAHGVFVMIQKDLGYTPTPVISHAILTHNAGRKDGLADGIVITPSHNPPEDGGFKYNPPEGGPASPETTKTIEDRANELLQGGIKDLKRIPFEMALKADNEKGRGEGWRTRRPGRIRRQRAFGHSSRAPLGLHDQRFHPQRKPSSARLRIGNKLGRWGRGFPTCHA